MPEPRLSVIVIGRNEAKHVRAIAASLQALAASLDIETIFVDSASSDDSVAVACDVFDVVAVMSEDRNLSASAGRYVGTQLARGAWMLYLDGDMELLSDFVPALLTHIATSPHSGLVGGYRYSYPDGSERMLIFPALPDGIVLAFGGAVLLPRDFVEGNTWDPRLFSNEEVEYYTRLRRLGKHVAGIPVPMVTHFTARISAPTMLRSLFFRSGSVLGKKFLGIGQVMAARYLSGTLLEFAAWYPEPFGLWAGILAGLLLGISGHGVAGAAALAVGVIFVSLRKGPKFVAVYLAFAVQTLHGWRTLDVNWRPNVAMILRRDASPADGAD